MSELRKDYILDRYVIIANDRAKRPSDFKKNDDDVKPEVDPFAPGNEGMTPPETDRISNGNDWKARVFPNKFPIVKPADDNSKITLRTDNTFFTFADAVGRHEVLVEHPDIDTFFHDLSTEEIKDILYMYRKRIVEISSKPEVKYVMVFKNHKKAAGTSLYHSHTQIIGWNTIPPTITAEEDACNRYKHCPYCDIIDAEKLSTRCVWEDECIVAFTPYASRFVLEVWVFPKAHVKSLCDLDDKEMRSLAACMRDLTSKLKSIDAPYNFELHNALDKSHFHIQITPRLTTWAGFEIGTDIIVNPTPPEEAAKFYRGE
jgi:UDPglucose--hexose-1-phosphate uridylyltransferase